MGDEDGNISMVSEVPWEMDDSPLVSLDQLGEHVRIEKIEQDGYFDCDAPCGEPQMRSRAAPWFVELTPEQVRQARRHERFAVGVDPIVEETAKMYDLTLEQAAYAIDAAAPDGSPAGLFHIVPELR